MVLAQEKGGGDIKQMHVEFGNITNKNLRKSLGDIRQQYNLSNKQSGDLINWTMDRLGSLRQAEENQTSTNRHQEQTKKLRLVMDEDHLAQLAYVSATNRARELVESNRLNPYLLTKNGMKMELQKRMELLHDDPNKILVLVAFDLDDFKIVNDLYGHHEGDKVLMAMGKALEIAMRESDVAAHYSGDEFGFVLEANIAEQKFDGANVSTIINRIIQEIVEKIQPLVPRPENKDGEVEVQEFSAGFKIIQSEEKLSLDELLKQADKASQTSKTLRALRKTDDGQAIGSKDRIVDFTNNEEELAEYGEDEIRRAVLMHRLKRPVHDAYPTLDIQALTEMISNFIRMFETTTKLSDIHEDELEDEVKRFIGNLLRTQQDNEAAKKFFTKDDENTNQRFSGNKTTGDIHKEEEYRIRKEGGLIEKLRSWITSR